MRTFTQQARRAGLLYLLLGISAPLGLLVVPGRVHVAGDATATAANLRALEGLVRLGIGSELFHQVVVVFVALALYRLFRGVNEGLAKQVLVMGAYLPVPIMFANVLNHVAALALVSGASWLAAFEPAQLDSLAYLFVRLHDRGIMVASVFWGLWLFPMGLLVVRSGRFPAVIGWLLWVAGAAYLAAAFAGLVAPSLAPKVGPVAEVLAAAELPVIFAVLGGGRRNPVGAPANVSGAGPASRRLLAGSCVRSGRAPRLALQPPLPARRARGARPGAADIQRHSPEARPCIVARPPGAPVPAPARSPSCSCSSRARSPLPPCVHRCS